MTKRFENAVMKLYDAFHNNTLRSMDCEKCAVGSIVGGNEWSKNFTYAPLRRVTYIKSEKENRFIINTGYSQSELQEVERVFIETMYPTLNSYDEKKYRENKNMQFEGLCAVVEYLCELDNIPNVMDYKWLFESEENKPEKVFSHEYN